MKILFATHQTGFQQHSGGGEIQLSKTQTALEAQDVTVDRFDPFETQIHEYDLLHVFSSHPDLFTLVEYADQVGVPTVVSPIYYDNVHEILQSPLWFAKNTRKYPYSLKSVLSKSAERVAPEKLVSFLDRKKRLYDATEVLFPNSHAEGDLLARRFDTPPEKIHVVPNGVDEQFADATPEVFKATYDAEDFVLMVCSIDPRKNLITALEALEGVGKDIVVIGSPRDGKKEDQRYAKRFERTASELSEEVYLLGHVNHENDLLAGAYAACDVFLLPSWFETPGLVALEAGLSGAKVAITEFGPTKEYFRDHVQYLDPTSERSIRRGVQRAARKPDSAELRKHIEENYLWQHVATTTKSAYEELIND
jgi:glycosyltransferase involved in cell wall biosynthesis